MQRERVCVTDRMWLQLNGLCTSCVRTVCPLEALTVGIDSTWKHRRMEDVSSRLLCTLRKSMAYGEEGKRDEVQDSSSSSRICTGYAAAQRWGGVGGVSLDAALLLGSQNGITPCILLLCPMPPMPIAMPKRYNSARLVAIGTVLEGCFSSGLGAIPGTDGPPLDQVLRFSFSFFLSPGRTPDHPNRDK